jgi:hypothetical protein
MKISVDFTNMTKKYPGQWIVLDNALNKVVTYSSNAKKAYKNALNKGLKKPILFKVPRKITPYFGTQLS